MAKSEIQARVTEVATLLGIQEQLQHKPQQLSGGQRQRVALGRAIVRRPQLFLFDEPLSNLDATLRANMRVELAKLHERLGATMLYVTHDQAEAMTLGEKIIVLHRGALQQIGTPADIYHRPRNTFVAAFVGHPQMNLFDGQLDENGTSLKTGKMRLDLSNMRLNNRSACGGARVTLGIRPEDFHLSSAADAWISASAEFVEDLGSDCFVHLSCGDLELVARLPAHHPIKRGDRLNLKIDPQRAHLFHEGRRVDSDLPGGGVIEL
jgi:ABC-type sugar transport system ATPase subunit